MEHYENWNMKKSEWTPPPFDGNIWKCYLENALFQPVSHAESVWASNGLPALSQINVLKSHGQSSHESILIPNGYAMQIMRASQDCSTTAEFEKNMMLSLFLCGMVNIT